MNPGSGLPGVSDAAALGVDTLAAVLAGAPDGVTVVDPRRRFVYANPAACEMLGRPLEQLHGQDFVASIPIPARDREFALARLAERRGRVEGDPGEPFTATLVRADGSEREIVAATFPIELDGIQHGVTVFRDVSQTRSASRAAKALGQTTAQLVGSGTADEMLVEIARHAVEGTAALACGIDVVADDRHVSAAGGYGFPFYLSEGGRSGLQSRAARAAGHIGMADFTGGAIRVGDRPGRPIVMPDARIRWEANPVTAHFASTMAALDWRGAVYVPLAWENRVFGFCCVYLPAGSPGPTEAELAFYAVLADQAAIAVTNASLSARAGEAAALLERSRLARELHDSVSQALFSMTMHAGAAQLATTAAGYDLGTPLGQAIAELAELIRGATAEMRALIFELRPGGLAEEGLVAALRTQAAALAARERLTIAVDGPDGRLALEGDVAEHVYRITSEALHNVVKHSQATRATVSITEAADRLTVLVGDDGIGFDPSGDYVGHLGLSTMSERAELISGTLSVASAPGHGTEVTVSVSLRRQQDAASARADVAQARAGRRTLASPETPLAVGLGDAHQARGDGEGGARAGTDGDSIHEAAIGAAAVLGVPTLAMVLAGAPVGITIVDAERRYHYANPAACQMLGRPLAELRGRDLLSHVPTREHPLVQGQLAQQLRGEPAVFSSTLVDDRGREDETVSSAFAISIAGVPHGVTLLRSVTDTQTEARAATALAQAAAQIVGADTTAKILSGLARHAVEGTRALACGISAVGSRDGRIEAGGHSHFGPMHDETHSDGTAAIIDVPITQAIEALTGGAIRVGALAAKPLVITDAREMWRRYACLDGFRTWTEAQETWQGAAVFVPLLWESRVFGLFAAYPASGVAGPNEEELALYTALADQAAVAVMSARLAAEARDAATLLERSRLARDLHDSVSQALFSLTMRVRAAQGWLTRAGADPDGSLTRSIGELAKLSRGAMAEMRALIFELRPGAVAEEGLVEALRKQAAALNAREDLLITVEAPGEPPELDAVVAEQLYRIASEALRSAITRGRATRAAVTIRSDDEKLRMEITDGGGGVAVDGESALRGQRTTMNERAGAIGAELTTVSSLSGDTTVTVLLAITALTGPGALDGE
jgi:PAS domain S-box-containing protein